MSEKPEELLPCPFCGSEAVMTQIESAGGNGRMIWIVGCYSEDCDVRFPGHARQIDATTAWNTRRFQADTRAGMAAYRALQRLCENDEERECLASKNSDGLFSHFLLTRLKGDTQPKVKCRECGHRFHENECQTSIVSFKPQRSTPCGCRGCAAITSSPWVEIKSEAPK